MGGLLSSPAFPANPVAVPPSLAALVGVRGEAVVPAGQRVIEVPEVLAGVLPDGGLRRGSLVSVEAAAPGGTALVLALAAVATRAGSWCAVVGLPELGLVAADQLGIRLDRFALIPRPGSQWAMVAAALLEGADLLLIRPPSSVSPGDARRLVARARERDAVLVVTGSRRWPEAADLRLRVVGSSWTGLGQGRGYLGDREVEVAVTGRRAAVRERRCRLLLPGPDGGLEAWEGEPADRRAGVADRRVGVADRRVGVADRPVGVAESAGAGRGGAAGEAVPMGGVVAAG